MPGHPSVRPGRHSPRGVGKCYAVNRAVRSMPSRANTPLANDTPEPLSGEAQREASRLRDRHDSFINEAYGRDQPVDLKPQAREVR
jgi:hypothetical protein